MYAASICGLPRIDFLAVEYRILYEDVFRSIRPTSELLIPHQLEIKHPNKSGAGRSKIFFQCSTFESHERNTATVMGGRYNLLKIAVFIESTICVVFGIMMDVVQVSVFLGYLEI